MWANKIKSVQKIYPLPDKEELKIDEDDESNEDDDGKKSGQPTNTSHVSFEQASISQLDRKKKAKEEYEKDPAKDSRKTIYKILIAWAVTVPAAIGLGYFITWMIIKFSK